MKQHIKTMALVFVLASLFSANTYALPAGIPAEMQTIITSVATVAGLAFLSIISAAVWKYMHPAIDPSASVADSFGMIELDGDYDDLELHYGDIDTQYSASDLSDVDTSDDELTLHYSDLDR